jgi:hypothetical protein
MRTKEAIQSDIEGIDPIARRVRARIHAAREEIAMHEAVLLPELLLAHSSHDLDSPANNLAPVAAIARSDRANEIARFRACLSILEGTEQHKKHGKKLDELFSELENAND